MLQRCWTGMLGWGLLIGIPYLPSGARDEALAAQEACRERTPGDPPHERSWSTPCSPRTPPLPEASCERDRYAQRDSSSRDLEDFRGGAVVIIVGAGTLLIVLILLIILL
jgi:hypothetical protein